MRVTVLGAGGMIGGHLVAALLEQGHEVRAVDIKAKADWWQRHSHGINLGQIDLRRPGAADHVIHGAEQVYNLSENMGGIGFITTNKVDCAESIEIGISVMRACEAQSVRTVFFSSSACVYPTHIQEKDDDQSMRTSGLKENEAWPARPEEGYGFAKLYMEELCHYYAEERGLNVRIARYHNVYGAHGSWKDGREKAPAALCRKVAEAVLTNSGKIDVWGDGQQLRSYLDVSDCVSGTIALMNHGTHDKPINIGSDRSVTVNEMLAIIEGFDGVELEHNYQLGEATGVAVRNADISAAKWTLGWKPQVTLEDGLRQLYDWIKPQLST
jgi:GDP-D-mannose 3', 5'-epimerase